MPIELKVPPVGESITEVEIGEWLKSPGDGAVQDETLVLIETDKVTVELPAPVAGKLTKILKAAGQSATIGEVIGYMEAGGAPAPSPAPSAAAKSPTKPAQAPEAAKTAAPEKIMPAARRALAEHGLAPDQVVASGAGGRLLKEDVQRHVAEPGRPTPTSPTSAAEPVVDRSSLEEVVPMTPMRRRIAQRLVESQNQAALLTTFNEIDMSEVMNLRKQHRDAFLERYGIKLGFMSFFVKAVVDALRLVPEVNAEIRESSIVYRNYHDIGVAVGGGKGLVVPILRDAGRLSFAEVEQAIDALARRAKENKLKIEDLQGGTFTISNGGIYGSLLSTPIVNPPQSGILGMHAIQDRPIAVDGQVVIRPMMYVALTYDHRVIDGREAVTFLKRVKECLETPTRMLIEI